MQVAGSLARTAGRREVVGVVFEVTGFEGDEGEDGGHFVDVVDGILGEGGDEEGGCLRAGFAFGWEGGTGAGVGGRCDLEDDVGSAGSSC